MAAPQSKTGVMRFIQSVTADYTMTQFDALVKVDTTTTCTITLPDATKMGGLYCTVVRTVGILTVMTIQGQSGQTINGAATLIVPTVLYSAYSFISDGLNWFVT